MSRVGGAITLAILWMFSTFVVLIVAVVVWAIGTLALGTIEYVWHMRHPFTSAAFEVAGAIIFLAVLEFYVRRKPKKLEQRSEKA